MKAHTEVCDICGGCPDGSSKNGFVGRSHLDFSRESNNPISIRAVVCQECADKINEYIISIKKSFTIKMVVAYKDK